MTFNDLEDWIALLQMELKITKAQAEPWNSFADSLRLAAKRMSEARLAMQSGGRPETFSQRLEATERILSAGLENTRALRASFMVLIEVLSDKQKKAAHEVFAVPASLGLGAIFFDRAEPTVH